MSNAATLVAVPSVAEVQALAAAWYRKLDVHAPLVEVLPLLADDGLEMKFPEATLHGVAAFEAWYEGVIRIFFDEVHSLKKVESRADEEGVTVKVVVHWEASRWNPPAANSDRIKLDAFQTWRVVRSPITGRAVVSQYTVDELVYDADSARL